MTDLVVVPQPGDPLARLLTAYLDGPTRTDQREGLTMPTARAVVTWRYLTRGKAKHALPLDSHSHTGHQVFAVCGTGPSWFDPIGWLGTGTQTEYETVDRLPECRRCARLLTGGNR